MEEICRKLGMEGDLLPMEFGKTVTGGRVSLPDRFAGMGTAEIRRLKQLEDENTKLKRLVADLSLDETMLQDVLRKSGEAQRLA